MAFHRDARPDPSTADRLLAGRIGADDAPPGYRRVAELLGAAGSGFSEPPAPEEGALIGAMVAAIQAEPVPAFARRKSMLRKVLAAKTIAIASVLALSATGAAAGTGNLPDAVQAKVAKAAKHVGVNLPEGKGVARITATCPDGQTFKNRGQFLKWVREHNPGDLEAAKTSTCGMPVTSKGTPGADEAGEAGEAPEAPEGSKAPKTPKPPKADKSNAPEDRGKAPEDAGNAPDDPGKAPQDPGNAPEDPGNAPEDPGNAPVDPGNAPVDPGNPPVVPGNPPVDPGPAPEVPGTPDGETS